MRLRLARNLLKDDGVIFISIDDNEVHNLRKMCDEIFGENSFYSSFVWQKRSGSMDSVDGVSVDHEYVLCYGKNKLKLKGVERTFDKYENPDNDPRGPWISDNLSAGKAGGNVYYEITDPKTGNTFLPPKGRYWPYNPTSMAQKIAEDRVIFPKDETGRPMLKRFKNEAKSNFVPVSSLLRNYTEKKLPNNAIVSALNTKGTAEIQNLFDNKIFSFPKSTILLKSLMSQIIEQENNDIILDFFSGSSTTAHAIMQLNADDGGNRKFIMVQLPEETDEKSEAYKAGYKTIAGIGKERIRRAGKKIIENLELKMENEKNNSKLDIGFRVLKIDESNMKDIYFTPDAVDRVSLFDTIDHIKEDRTAEDLLFGVLVDWGVDLTLPIRRETIHGKTVFFVGHDDLTACFDENLDVDFVKELAGRDAMRVVFKESGFKDDETKINTEQIFAQLAPNTDIKVI